MAKSNTDASTVTAQDSKAITSTRKDLKLLKERLLKKAEQLNSVLVSYTGVPQVLPEDSVLETSSILEYLDFIENLKYTCESIKLDIHGHREDVRIRIKALNDFL